MRVGTEISGTTSLLMNRFHENNEADVTAGFRPAFQGDPGTPREQAYAKAYMDHSGTLYIPGPNIFAAIIEAGKFHKVGKRQLTTRDTSLIPAGCMIEEMVCSLNTDQFEIDCRSVVNPATGGRRMCYRPRIDNWKLSFTLDIDKTVFDPKLIRAVLDDAGKKIGLGDYRPARKGPFGRFVVTRWEEIAEVAAA